MGGAARIIRRVFAPTPAYTPPPAQTVTAAPAPAATTVSGRTAKVRGQGMGTTGTIMTGATDIEEEANVSKTVLGGATTKKKKYKV
jgi:hypothetical protein